MGSRKRLRGFNEKRGRASNNETSGEVPGLQLKRHAVDEQCQERGQGGKEGEE